MENTIVEAIRNRIPRSGEGAGRLEGSRGAMVFRTAGEEVMKNSKKRLVRGAATSLEVSSLKVIGSA